MGSTAWIAGVASGQGILMAVASRSQTTMMRVSRRAREDAEALAAATGKPMSLVIEEALAALRKAAYWRQFRDGMERLEADSAAQAGEESDLDLYEGTLMDGLQDEEPYPYPGRRSG
jgi:hypothetical protein